MVLAVERPVESSAFSVRHGALVVAGAAAMSGHVAPGLAQFGPAVLLPLVLMGMAVLGFVLSLPGRGHVMNGADLIAGAVVVFAPAFMLAGSHEYATGKLLGLLQVSIPIVIVTVLLVERPADLERFWQGVVGASVFAVVVACLEVLAGVDIGARGSINEGAFNPIAAGRAATVVCTWLLFGGSKSWPAAARLGMLGASALVLFSSSSRGPILGLLLAALVAAARNPVVRGRLALLVFAVGGAAVAGLGAALANESSSRLLESGPASPTSRWNLWSEGLDAFLTRPWGWGLGQYGAPGTYGAAFDYAHNIVLEIGVEAGLVAALGFVLISARAIVRMWASEEDTALRHLTMLVFWLETAQFSSDLNGNRVLLAGLLASVVAYRSSTKVGRT